MLTCVLWMFSNTPMLLCSIYKMFHLHWHWTGGNYWKIADRSKTLLQKKKKKNYDTSTQKYSNILYIWLERIWGISKLIGFKKLTYLNDVLKTLTVFSFQDETTEWFHLCLLMPRIPCLKPQCVLCSQSESGQWSLVLTGNSIIKI